MALNFKNTINKAIDFLTRSQQKNGSFLSYSSKDKNNFSRSIIYHSTFSSSLILACLSDTEPTKKVKIIKDKLALFLLSQKSEHWSFNYWARDSRESKKLPYPDDLDDTFCALVALTLYNPKLINGKVLAKIARLLTLVEQKPGGPYRTWLVPKTAKKVWQDIDLAVNSNIAYFLSLHNISLPNLNKLIQRAIENKKYQSPYYPSAYPVIYFISRFYRGNKIKKIQSFVLAQQNNSGAWDNPLNTALSICSLLNLGVLPSQLEKSISFLTQNQKSDGSWSPSCFCLDPAINRKIYYAGSPSLTTAFCLQAIGLYLKAIKKQVKPLTPATNHASSPESRKIYNTVIELAKQRYSSLDKNLQSQALIMLNMIVKKDKDKQIILLPYFFALSLNEHKKIISGKLLAELGLANLYGWIAYTIYDDFLDNEGKPELLPVANVCLRELTKIYNNILPNNSDWINFFENTIDKIEEANCWEALHCGIKNKQFQIPDFGDLSKLAERSLGHMLGPSAILFYLGYKNSSPKVKNLTMFFKHYLIARQLNDDAHDWEYDLKRDQINSVSALILKNLKGDIENNYNKLQKIFWYKIIRDVSKITLTHTKLAKQALKIISLIKNRQILENLLIPIEQSSKNALLEQKTTIEFLENY